MERLAVVSVPWVVENVPEAPLRADYILCGSQFGLKACAGDRVFQVSWGGFRFAHRAPCSHRELTAVHSAQRRARTAPTPTQWAMGIDWMSKEEARQAIPPAYSEHIGLQLLEHLAVTA